MLQDAEGGMRPVTLPYFQSFEALKAFPYPPPRAGKLLPHTPPSELTAQLGSSRTLIESRVTTRMLRLMMTTTLSLLPLPLLLLSQFKFHYKHDDDVHKKVFKVTRRSVRMSATAITSTPTTSSTTTMVTAT
jgi:hypothetical protein